jgi:hypothetical protein
MSRPRPVPKHGLTFTPGNHQYRLDGRPVPGVTSILGVLDKPAIPKWAAATVATYVAENPDAVETLRNLGDKAMIAALKEIPWKRRDDAGTRGNILHDYAEALLNGDEIDVDDEHVPVMENALAFMDDWRIEPILVEAAVASREHWWAGTLDLVARFSHPEDPAYTGVAIFDWKSGRALYPEYAWQLNAYAHAEFHGLAGDEHPIPECSAAFGVHIRADGYDVAPFAFGPHIYDEFLAIRRTFDIVKKGRGDWKVPGSGHVGIMIQAKGAA